MGYSLNEIKGQHMSMLLPTEATRQSPEYRNLWEKLKPR